MLLYMNPSDVGYAYNLGPVCACPCGEAASFGHLCSDGGAPRRCGGARRALSLRTPPRSPSAAVWPTGHRRRGHERAMVMVHGRVALGPNAPEYARIRSPLSTGLSRLRPEKHSVLQLGERRPYSAAGPCRRLARELIASGSAPSCSSTTATALAFSLAIRHGPFDDT